MCLVTTFVNAVFPGKGLFSRLFMVYVYLHLMVVEKLLDF